MNELYFESGYLEASYFGNLAIAYSDVSFTAGLNVQGDIASTTGYYIPDYIAVDYFFAFVSASAAITSSFASVSVVNKTTSANAVFTAAFTQTATISHIEGADLFAFSNAAIAVQVSRLRDNNIAVSAVFGIAVDVVRIKSSSGDDFAEFSFTANTVLARSRDYASSQSAAFSLPDVPADKTARTSSSQSSQFTQTAVVSKTVVATANIESFASILVSRNVGEPGRPRNLIDNFVNGGPGFTTNAKFGSHSLSGGNNFVSPTKANNFVVPTSAQSFYLEMWHYPTTSDTNHDFFSMFEFFIISQTNTGKYKFQGRGGNPNDSGNAMGAYGYTHTTNHTLNQWNHLAIVKQGNSLSYYINGTRVKFWGYPTTTADPNEQLPFYGWGSTGNQAGGVYATGTIRTSNIICRVGPGLLDEVYFVHDTTLGQSPTSATIDVPTQARSNTTDTQFLYHFDNNVNDDVSIQHLGAAGLTSASSVSAIVGFITNAEANLLASSSVTAIIGTLESINLLAFSDAAVITNGIRIRISTADCSTSSSVSATASRIKQIASNITAESTTVLTPTRLRDTAIALSSAATVSAIVNVQRSGSAGISTNATVTAVIGRLNDINLVAFANGSTTATAVKNAVAQSSITGLFTQSASAVKTAVSASAVTSEHSLTAINSRTRNASANFALSVSTETQGNKVKGSAVALTSAFNTTTRYLEDGYIESGYYEQFETVAVKTASGTAAIQSVSTLTVGITTSVFAVLTTQSSSNVTASVNKTASVQIANASVFAQTAIASRTRSTASTFTVNATVTANGLKGGDIALVAFTNASVSILTTINKPASAGLNTTATFIVNTQDSLSITASSNLNVGSTVTSSAKRFAVAQAQIQAAGFVVSVSVAQKIFLAQFATVSTFTAVAVKTTTIQSNITGVSNVNAIVGVRKPFTAAITSALTFVVAVRELRLDAIVYVIPAEGWTYRIEGETRLHTILGESRVKEIVGESRLHTINGESRIHII